MITPSDHTAASAVVFVNAPSGDHILCVTTEDQADGSWEASNEGYALLRRVSALLWEHFEPGRPRRPAGGAERFRP